MTDCSSLSCVSATLNVNDYIEFSFCLCSNQWLTYNNL